MDGWRRCQITKNQTEGVIGPNLVVTIGDDEKDGKFINPPAKEAEQLKGRAVSPVGVFGNDDGWPGSGSKGREHLPKEPVPRVALQGVLVAWVWQVTSPGRALDRRSRAPRARDRLLGRG